MARFFLKAYYVLTVPVAILFILNSKSIHPAYRMSAWRKLTLGLRMFFNTIRIRTGTSYKSHLAMALKILETPPEVKGDILECGTWKGGTAANLSLVCAIVGRTLRVYDSFEGLPAGTSEDREAKYYKAGDYCGTLDEVKANIGRCGVIERCQFVEGWFDATLPALDTPVLLAYLDVDLEASLHTCVRYIWPKLVDQGFIFIDEFVGLDYCALFYSERYWQTYFQRTPPGLIGAGTGLPLGEYYIGPFSERGQHPTQHANAGAYTRKDYSGVWTYFPTNG
ncbi:MAG: TylF/MycF/NovP-related O-methyltransferase [Gemmatimonadota bacterium]